MRENPNCLWQNSVVGKKSSRQDDQRMDWKCNLTQKEGDRRKLGAEGHTDAERRKSELFSGRPDVF